MPAKVLVETKDMPREQWLEWRRRGIGSSDAAAVAGLHPWLSAIEVWAEKTGFALPKEPSEQAEERMHWGNVLEDVIAREFAERNQVRVRRRNAILQHPDYPFMIATLDRIVTTSDGPAVLEVKTTAERHRGQWVGQEGEALIPDWYAIQVQHQLAVTGYNTAYVAVLIGGQEYQERLVPRDEELIESLIQIEERFWTQHVLTGNPPPPSQPQDAELVDKLYPGGKPEPITLPDDALELIEAYERWSDIERQARDTKETIKARLQAMMGDHEIGVVGNRKVRWTTYETTRFNAGALRVAHPEIWEEFAEKRTVRRFSVA